MAKQTTNLTDIIEQEKARKAYRDEYNTRPKVQARRKLYNQLRLDETKIARKVMNGTLKMADAEKQIEVLRKTYNDNLAKLNGQELPSAHRAQNSSNGGA